MAQVQKQSISQSDNSRNHHLNNITKLEDIQVESRYPDSGAINLITSNLDNLNLDNKEYIGNQVIHMSNVESIKITHIGIACIKGERQLYLNNLQITP